ncbi:hypothetical protein IFR05_005996 [Cadophora sp. M221]|nr:hypothetical protein IFR05_005996 [Cadophora sp. M221]
MSGGLSSTESDWRFIDASNAGPWPYQGLGGCHRPAALPRFGALQDLLTAVDTIRRYAAIANEPLRPDLACSVDWKEVEMRLMPDFRPCTHMEAAATNVGMLLCALGTICYAMRSSLCPAMPEGETKNAQAEMRSNRAPRANQ